MTEDDVDPVIQVLRTAFPKARIFWHESAGLWWNAMTLTRDAQIEAVNISAQEAALADLERGLRMAAQAMQRLAAPIRAEVEAVHRANAEARLEGAARTVTRDRLSGPTGKSEVLVTARDLINRLHLGVIGSWPMETGGPTVRQASAISSARKALRRMDGETAQARRADLWRKVALVGHVRAIWAQYGGTAAPSKRLNPASPFAEFLSGLIAAIGEDWDAASAFAAWHREQVHS